MNWEISPLMIPFIASLWVEKVDEEDRLFFTVPDANHNAFSPKTAKEIMNNLLNNVLEEEETAEPTLGVDTGVLMLPTSGEDGKRVSSDLLYNCLLPARMFNV